MKDPRPEKVAVVDELKQKFADADGTILTEYRGLDGFAMAQLRNALREAGGEYKIYKNTLVRLAARDVGLEIEDLLVGPTAITFVAERTEGSQGDAAAVAKALQTFEKSNQFLLIKGGVLNNKPLDPAAIKALAALPSRVVLLAQLAGAFQAPMTKFAGLLAAVPRHFGYALSALIEERGGLETATEIPADSGISTENAAIGSVSTDDAGTATTNDVQTTTAQTDTATGVDETQTQTEASADTDAGNAGEYGEASQDKEA